MRRTVHAQQVRDPSTRKLPLSEHLDICCETEPKLKQLSARLVKEQFFIKIFKPHLKMLGLYLYTLIIDHKSCNMLSILNKLTL